MKGSRAGRLAAVLLSLAIAGAPVASAWAQGSTAGENTMQKEQAEAVAAKTKKLIDRAAKDGNRPRYVKHAKALYAAGEDALKDGDYDTAISIFHEADHQARMAWLPF
jgi:TolA-binding protein